MCLCSGQEMGHLSKKDFIETICWYFMVGFKPVGLIMVRNLSSIFFKGKELCTVVLVRVNTLFLLQSPL